ncbi:hypothetical protein SHIRM173S_00420 [Streptomyces hirsutus]
MRSPLRRLGPATVLAFVLALFGMAPQATAADPAPAELTFTTDTATTTPGGTVQLSMTLTNNRTYDIWFVYQTIDPTWLTTQRPDLKYGFTGCALVTAAGSTPCAGTGPCGPRRQLRHHRPARAKPDRHADPAGRTRLRLQRQHRLLLVLLRRVQRHPERRRRSGAHARDPGALRLTGLTSLTGPPGF